MFLFRVQWTCLIKHVLLCFVGDIAIWKNHSVSINMDKSCFCKRKQMVQNYIHTYMWLQAISDMKMTIADLIGWSIVWCTYTGQHRTIWTGIWTIRVMYNPLNHCSPWIGCNWYKCNRLQFYRLTFLPSHIKYGVDVYGKRHVCLFFFPLRLHWTVFYWGMEQGVLVSEKRKLTGEQVLNPEAVLSCS